MRVAAADEERDAGARAADFAALQQLLLYEARRPMLDEPERRAAFLEGALFWLDGCAAYARLYGDFLPVARRAIAIAEPEDAADFGWRAARIAAIDLRSEAALELADAALARLDATSGHSAWCHLARAIAQRLDSRPRDALAELDAASAAPALHGDLRDALVAAERAAVYLELGLPDLALAHVRDQRESATCTRDAIALAGAELMELRLELASGRPTGVAARALARAAELAAPDPTCSLLLNRIERRRARTQFELVAAVALIAQVDEQPGHASDARELLRGVWRETSAPVPAIERCETALQWSALALRRGELESAETNLDEARKLLAPRLALGRQSLHSVRLEASSALVLARRAQDADATRRPTREALEAARERLARGWEWFLERWRDTPALETGVAFLQQDVRRTVLGASFEIDLALDGPRAGARRAFETLLGAQALGTLARRRECAPATLAHVQQWLAEPAQGLLVFVPAAERSHLFLVDARDIEHVDLAGEATLRVAQRALAREVLVRPARADQAWETAARGLSSLLLPPAARARIASWSRASIVGADLLGFVPFEILPLDDGARPRRFGEHVALAYVPSLPLVLQLAHAPRTRSKLELAVLAAPSTTLADVDAIRWSADDELDFTEPFGRAATRIESGARARLSSLAGSAPRRWIVLAHGVADAARARPAGIALASERAGLDGCVFSAELERFWSREGPPQLAFLAACGAARAPTRRGDDAANHLGGTLLAAGVRAVLLSPADLDIESTRVLVREYLRSDAAGAPPSRALMDARARVAADARFAHPYFHALLQATGLAHESLQ